MLPHCTCTRLNQLIAEGGSISLIHIGDIIETLVFISDVILNGFQGGNPLKMYLISKYRRLVKDYNSLRLRGVFCTTLEAPDSPTAGTYLEEMAVLEIEDHQFLREHLSNPND